MYNKEEIRVDKKQNIKKSNRTDRTNQTDLSYRDLKNGIYGKSKTKSQRLFDRRYIHRLEDKVSLIAKEREQLQSWSDRICVASKAFKDDLKKAGAGPFCSSGFCSGLRSSQTCTTNPFDMQILAGIIIHQGRVAEMKAGEGKL